MGYTKEPKISIKESMSNDTCCSCGIYSDKVFMKRIFIGNFAFAICRRCRDILAEEFSIVDKWEEELDEELEVIVELEKKKETKRSKGKSV